MKIIIFDILLVLLILYTVVVAIRSKSRLFNILVLFFMLFNCTARIILRDVETAMNHKVLYYYYDQSFWWIQFLMECYVIYEFYKLIKKIIIKAE